MVAKLQYVDVGCQEEEGEPNGGGRDERPESENSCSESEAGTSDAKSTSSEVSIDDVVARLLEEDVEEPVEFLDLEALTAKFKEWVAKLAR